MTKCITTDTRFYCIFTNKLITIATCINQYLNESYRIVVGVFISNKQIVYIYTPIHIVVRLNKQSVDEMTQILFRMISPRVKCCKKTTRFSVLDQKN